MLQSRLTVQAVVVQLQCIFLTVRLMSVGCSICSVSTLIVLDLHLLTAVRGHVLGEHYLLLLLRGRQHAGINCVCCINQSSHGVISCRMFVLPACHCLDYVC